MNVKNVGVSCHYCNRLESGFPLQGLWEMSCFFAALLLIYIAVDGKPLQKPL